MSISIVRLKIKKKKLHNYVLDLILIQQCLIIVRVVSIAYETFWGFRTKSVYIIHMYLSLCTYTSRYLFFIQNKVIIAKPCMYVQMIADHRALR